MAHDESVLSELLAAVKAGDGTDLIRELAQWALQQLIDTEATGVIGASRYERTSCACDTAPAVLSSRLKRWMRFSFRTRPCLRAAFAARRDKEQRRWRIMRSRDWRETDADVNSS
jgi:hypothetical protein